VQSYDETLSNILEKHAPVQRKVIMERTKIPWFNNELKHLKVNRIKLERKMLKSNCECDKSSIVGGFRPGFLRWWVRWCEVVECEVVECEVVECEVVECQVVECEVVEFEVVECEVVECEVVECEVVECEVVECEVVDVHHLIY
jgi:hypothetical protein